MSRDVYVTDAAVRDAMTRPTKGMRRDLGRGVGDVDAVVGWLRTAYGRSRLKSTAPGGHQKRRVGGGGRPYMIVDPHPAEGDWPAVVRFGRVL